MDDYPVSQFMEDVMTTVADSVPYIIPAGIFVAVVAFILAWFFYAVDIAGWTFGRKR